MKTKFTIFFLLSLTVFSTIEIHSTGTLLQSYDANAQIVTVTRPLWQRACVWVGGVILCSLGWTITDEMIEEVVPKECQEGQNTATAGAAAYCASEDPPNPKGCFKSQYCKSFCSWFNASDGTGECKEQRDLYGACSCTEA